MVERPSSNQFSATSSEKDAPDRSVVSIDPEIAAKRIGEGWAAQLIDVRTEQERMTDGWIAYSRHIPLSEFSARAGSEIDPAEPVLVYCQSGTQSLFAAEALLGGGYQQVHDLQGGLSAWSEAGLTVETD